MYRLLILSAALIFGLTLGCSSDQPTHGEQYQDFSGAVPIGPPPKDNPNAKRSGQPTKVADVPSKGGATATVSNSGDYLPGHLYLAKMHPNSGRWAPSLLQRASAGAGLPGKFVDVRSNRAFETATYTQTVPATAQHIRVGAPVFCMYGTYVEQGKARRRWKDIVYHWERTTVVDVSDLDKGYFEASVSGQLRKIHISNVRVKR